MKTLRRIVCALVISVPTSLFSAHAGIQIVGTRVIYPADQREVTVSVRNNGTAPRLIQSWVDSGNPEESAESTDAPFLITPPMSRVDPGKGQSLRLMFMGENQPQDRESVFYLNVLEVPPKPERDAGANYLQFAVRTRIKIFYRPSTLVGSPDSSAEQLGWRLFKNGGNLFAECTNSTAYNVSFTDVRLRGPDSGKDSGGGNGGMCPAKGRQTFPMGTGLDAGRIVFRYIDDFGATIEREAAYTN